MPAGIVATSTNHAIRSSGVSIRRRRSVPRNARDEPDDVAPEVRGDGDERPQVERDVERLVEAVVLLEVRPLRAPGDEDEVTRRRDREELGEALDDAEDERLAVRERVRVVRDAGNGEHAASPSAAPATT